MTVRAQRNPGLDMIIPCSSDPKYPKITKKRGKRTDPFLRLTVCCPSPDSSLELSLAAKNSVLSASALLCSSPPRYVLSEGVLQVPPLGMPLCLTATEQSSSRLSRSEAPRD